MCYRVPHFVGAEMLGGEGGNAQPRSCSGRSEHAEYTSTALTTTVTTTESPPPPTTTAAITWLEESLWILRRAEGGRGGTHRNGYLGHRAGWVIYKRMLLNVLEPVDI